jgi:hypothetical protein
MPDWGQEVFCKHFLFEDVLSSFANDNCAVRAPSSSGRTFQSADLVEIRRDLMVGGDLIPQGAAGQITIVREPAQLYDVCFSAHKDIIITIAHHDLFRL